MGYDLVSDMLSIAEALIKGYCFYCLIKPFMISEVTSTDVCALDGTSTAGIKGKKRAICVGAVYFLIMLVLYIAPLHVTAQTAYGMGSLIIFCFICWMDRRNYRQKAFLVVVFFSLNWLSAAMAEIMYDNLYAFAENTDYMRSCPEIMWIALYAGVCLFYLTLEFSFTAIGIWQVLKAYRNKSEDMKTKEVIMLSVPSLMGMMAYQIIRNYRMFYIIEGGRDTTAYDILTVLFYAVSVIAIVVAIVLYQDIKAKQKENRQAEYLAMQIENIRQHIEQVESFHQSIRSMKHDMTNHVLTLERLYEENKAKEAMAYGTELKTALSEMTGEITSGNAVTDVILRERQREAEKLQICFHSEFYYPKDTDINAFDISVILNNALQNAIEHAAESKTPYLSIRSYHKNNAYMIEVRNSFDGNLQWDMESGLPVTSKGQTDGHGYGLPNIRRVARKYSGDIAIDVKDGEFCLSVMLMME
ncbi:MAG: GHKL domain-containing protein [Lachnospiraceae bacterium]|nr:GHKL domain-containing protein [Lachnospiraceae bacterium]